MEELDTQERKLDEIYCPSCGKPISKDAVVCPKCGVQVKELKVSQTSTESKTITPEEEMREGSIQLSGVRGWFWFMSVIFALNLIALPVVVFIQPNTYDNAIQVMGSVIGIIIGGGIWLALFAVPLAGVIKREPFSVPFVRVMLVITMFFFPIGTIIGAVLWKRINHPLAKKYLNYGV